MGIFGSKAPGGAASAPRTGAPAGGLSIVAVGMTVRGDIESDGIVKVEGAVEGHVLAQNQVLVSRGGLVNGDVETREAVVGGTVNGSITASERVEVQSGATVSGDITTRRIAVSEGGRLNGQIRMGVETPAARPAGASLDVRVSAGARVESRPAAPSRPSIPVARVAVPPRVTTPGQGT